MFKFFKRTQWRGSARKRFLMTRLSKAAKKGFTLIEVLAVLTILGIIIAIVAPAINTKIRQAKVKAAHVTIAAIEQALAAYALDCGTYPTTEQGLDALLNPPTVGTQCKNYATGGYWDKKTLPLDSWNHEFKYYFPGKTDPSKYEIISAGPDGIEGNDDDIKSGD